MHMQRDYKLLIVGGGLIAAAIASLILTNGLTDKRIVKTIAATRQSRLEAYGKQPLAFEAGDGLIGTQSDFLSHGPGYSMYLNPTDATFSFSAASDASDAIAKGFGVRMKLVGGDPKAKKAALGELPTKVNYFIGNDPARWRRDIATYARVCYHDVYPGIDLLYYGNQRQLEYDFVVAPGVRSNAIALDFEGADKVELNAEGNIAIHTPRGSVLSLHKPLVYQQIAGIRQQVPGSYLLRDQRVSFHLGHYDDSKPLVIDPVLVYSTEFGGGNGESGWAIAVNPAGEVYVTGDTNASDFPVAKPFQRVYGGSTDIFVSRLSSDGSKLLSSTYLGGSGADVGYGIALDKAGNIYVTGDTSSTDFPVVNPVQKLIGSTPDPDIFVAKFSPDGSKLLYSTYIGGSGGERGNGIAVDGEGSAYVTGYTTSRDFPTVAPFQKAYAGGPTDAFLLKVNPSGSKLVYSTYLGGGNDRPDIATSVAVDSGGYAYVTGFTNARDFPAVNSIQKFVGPTDAFVTKFNPSGSALVYSTFLGGNADDEAMGIAVDPAGNVYITGETESLDFPTTEGAFSRKCEPVDTLGPMRQLCAGGDAFLSKINPQGSALVYSTFINGDRFEVGRSVALDSAGSAYVTGITGSQNFPTSQAPQNTFGGGKFDGFVLKMNPAGSALNYSTFLGGGGNEGGYGIAVDPSGNAYVTGYTESPDFPTKKPLRRAGPGTSHGFRDVFITKIAKDSSQ